MNYLLILSYKLAKQAQYGEMTTLRMGSKTWVILNTSRMVNEIIVKRSSITHERPYFPIAGGLVSRDKRLFLQKTDEWKEGRRLIQQLNLGTTSSNHESIIEMESLGLLKAYLEEPEAWYAHNYRYPLSIIHRIITGQPLEKSRAELDALQRVTSTFLTSINGSYVDFFPQLALIPPCLQFWRPYWENLGDYHYNMFKHWWKEMKPEMDPGATPTFVREISLGGLSGTEEQAMYLAMLVLSAGSDNPRMTMNAWVMALLKYPDSVGSARQELDTTCGNDPRRLPAIGDLPNLPYVCAMIKEVLRWRPTVPLVPQRVLVEDLTFEKYHFPAGTEFLINSVAVCTHDYNAPSEFRPERWLKGHEGDVAGGIEFGLWQYAFGGGKRSCVGYRLAQKELFVAFARLLYCFDFAPRGHYDDSKLNAFSAGEPFPVQATPRSSAHEALIRNELEMSKNRLRPCDK